MTFSILHLDGHVDDTPTFEHEDDLKAFIRSHFPDAWFGEYEHAPHAPAAFCNVFESEIACDGGMEPIGSNRVDRRRPRIDPCGGTMG